MKQLTLKWSMSVCASIFINVQAHSTELQVELLKSREGVQAQIVRVDRLDQLKLFLNETDSKRPYHHFERIEKDLKPCQSLLFAMNAGMFHSDYSPVGLYIEAGKTHNTLNTEQGYGNFFLKPNGVLAWNKNQALIQETKQYHQSHFKAEYATQSGPMLVTSGEINSQFLRDSQSLKIRNGVGVKNDQLYLVISRNRVNFYQFARLFKDELQINDALYLDGSISSIFIRGKQQTTRYNLGPIIGLVQQQCTSSSRRP